MTNHTQRLLDIEKQIKECRGLLPIMIEAYQDDSNAIPLHMLETLATNSFNLEKSIKEMLSILLPDNKR